MPNKTLSATVFAKDLNEARRFFAEVLKWPIEDDSMADGYLVFTAPGGKSLLVEQLPTRTSRAAGGTGIDSAWSAVFQVEEKIADLESRAAAIADLDRDNLSDALRKKETEAKVDQELAELKKQAKSTKAQIGETKLVVEEEKKLLPAVRPKKGKNLPKKLKD